MPYGALKLYCQCYCDDFFVSGGNANALRGTETLLPTLPAAYPPCGGNANALRGRAGYKLHFALDIADLGGPLIDRMQAS